MRITKAWCLAILAACFSWSSSQAPPAQAQSQGVVQTGDLTDLLRLRVRHDFFADGRCSVCRVVPSHETSAILDRAGAAFFSTASEGRVAAASAEALEAVERLTFEVWITDTDFPRYTDSGGPVLSSEIAGFHRPNAQGQRPQAIVEVSFGANGTAPVEATIAYSSRTLLWRWIIVPSRPSDSFADWHVRRKAAPQAPVDQDPPEKIAVAGRPAWRIALRDPLPLRQRVPEDQVFDLVPPGDDASRVPIRLPTPGPVDLRQPSSQDGLYLAEMYVFP